MDVVSYLLGKNASGGGGGGSDISKYIPYLTYSENQSIPGILQSIKSLPSDIQILGTSLQYAFINCVGLTNIELTNTSEITNWFATFQGCGNLQSVSLGDTSKATTFASTFLGCTKLEDVSLFDTTNVTNMSNMFRTCPALTDVSLDNILRMCINATSYSSTQTLYALGFRSTVYSIERIEALPHYQDFVNAGWSIGY